MSLRILRIHLFRPLCRFYFWPKKVQKTFFPPSVFWLASRKGVQRAPNGAQWVPVGQRLGLGLLGARILLAINQLLSTLQLAR